MADIYVRLPYDPTGRNPNNLVSGELHTLVATSGFPYKIIDMVNGGFYARSVRVYDADYNRLTPEVDYILTYRYAAFSQKVGLDVCSDIVFLDPARTGSVYVSAQMVGGDVAFSLTAIADYVAWFKTQPSGYVPKQFDYSGNEPVWGPGELDKERWRLDTFQPFNNEIYQFARAVEGGNGNYEDAFRKRIQDKYQEFLNLFTDRLQRHIDDKDNPHKTDKTILGLGLVSNYRLATADESILATSNELYQTPELSWQTVNKWAMSPLVAHTGSTSNPHETTPAKIDSPTKAVVNASVQSKYGRHETVSNANLLTDTVTNWTYLDFYNYCRLNIPASNFAVGGTNGYMSPARIGRGNPNNNTVLTSDGNWVDWSSLMAQYAVKGAAQLKIFNFAISTPPDQAHAMAVSDPWAATARIGSMMLYRLSNTLTWGVGNGTGTTTQNFVYMSYRTASGWIRL